MSKIKISRAAVPEGSTVHRMEGLNHTDAYRSMMECNEVPSSDDISVLFWTQWPWPVRWLFALRNLVVKPFGLKGGKMDTAVLEQVIRNGGSTGFAAVDAGSEQETVLRLDDKHLTAWMSVYTEPGVDGCAVIYAITAVRYHKMLGRLYFNIIRPFHHIIVRSMMRTALKKYFRAG